MNQPFFLGTFRTLAHIHQSQGKFEVVNVRLLEKAYALEGFGCEYLHGGKMSFFMPPLFPRVVFAL